jgi:hypothetical protein
MSLHKAPFCCKYNDLTQDEISKKIDEQIRYMEQGRGHVALGIKCPGCGLMIENNDVTDCVQLHALVSLVKSGGSKMGPGLWR